MATPPPRGAASRRTAWRGCCPARRSSSDMGGGAAPAARPRIALGCSTCAARRRPPPTAPLAALPRFAASPLQGKERQNGEVPEAREGRDPSHRALCRQEGCHREELRRRNQQPPLRPRHRLRPVQGAPEGAPSWGGVRAAGRSSSSSGGQLLEQQQQRRGGCRQPSARRLAATHHCLWAGLVAKWSCAKVRAWQQRLQGAHSTLLGSEQSIERCTVQRSMHVLQRGSTHACPCRLQLELTCCPAVPACAAHVQVIKRSSQKTQARRSSLKVRERRVLGLPGAAVGGAFEQLQDAHVSWRQRRTAAALHAAALARIMRCSSCGAAMLLHAAQVLLPRCSAASGPTT